MSPIAATCERPQAKKSGDWAPFGHYSADSSVQDWNIIANRHAIRDSVFVPSIAKYFRPGSVLELGSAYGQMAERLQELGLEVVASDLHPFFVDSMKSRGITAAVVDATDISKYIDRKFDNVFGQGLTPQMRRDPEMVKRTYQSIYDALKDNGRYISICGTYRFKKRHARQSTYYSLPEQISLIREHGLFTIAAVIPHMIVPPSVYRHWNKSVLNFIDFTVAKLICNRHILVLDKRS